MQEHPLWALHPSSEPGFPDLLAGGLDTQSSHMFPALVSPLSHPSATHCQDISRTYPCPSSPCPDVVKEFIENSSRATCESGVSTHPRAPHKHVKYHVSVKSLWEEYGSGISTTQPPKQGSLI